MYAAGRMPDHVTRYNHKVNRWMPSPTVQRSTDAMEIVAGVLCAVALATALAVAVMILKF